MVAARRYYDTFVKIDSSCLFGERLLHVDWLEERALQRSPRLLYPSLCGLSTLHSEFRSSLRRISNEHNIRQTVA